MIISFAIAALSQQARDRQLKTSSFIKRLQF
jgi:hypothetical protein